MDIPKPQYKENVVTPYVGMSVTREAREEFRQLVYTLAPLVGRRVEMSETLEALCTIGRDNLDQLVTALNTEA